MRDNMLCLECGAHFVCKPRYLIAPQCPTCKSMDVTALSEHYSTLAEYAAERERE